ncbi:hypothetical protein LXA43DRAFT_1103718 [Ganoderma leucocontextum]|nr:hypothetical protein LXA43DRAFT_1103718 [Ganoderma leucocontextum]
MKTQFEQHGREGACNESVATSSTSHPRNLPKGLKLRAYTTVTWAARRWKHTSVQATGRRLYSTLRTIVVKTGVVDRADTGVSELQTSAQAATRVASSIVRAPSLLAHITSLAFKVHENPTHRPLSAVSLMNALKPVTPLRLFSPMMSLVPYHAFIPRRRRTRHYPPLPLSSLPACQGAISLNERSPESPPLRTLALHVFDLRNTFLTVVGSHMRRSARQSRTIRSGFSEVRPTEEYLIRPRLLRHAELVFRRRRQPHAELRAIFLMGSVVDSVERTTPRLARVDYVSSIILSAPIFPAPITNLVLDVHDSPAYRNAPSQCPSSPTCLCSRPRHRMRQLSLLTESPPACYGVTDMKEHLHPSGRPPPLCGSALTGDSPGCFGNG